MKCVLVLKPHKVVKEITILKIIHLSNANKQSIKNVNSKDALISHHVGYFFS